MSHCRFRWLHISDLHVGRNNDAQGTALGSLIRCIENTFGSLQFDAVLLTGDLAYSGSELEYREVENRFLVPLKRLACCKSATFVAVPGNHDLDCSNEHPPVWDHLGKSKQDKFFYAGDAGKQARGSRPKGFANFSAFCKRCGLSFVDPTCDPIARVSIPSVDAVQVLAIVTAFFSDREVSDYEKGPAPMHALRSMLEDMAGDELLIILGHHPQNWFSKESQSQLHSFLVENNAIYLHGHEHLVKSKFGARGLVSLGFGAGYQASQESSVASFYRNSFAVCELRDQLHVSVMSWDIQHGVWRPDQQLPGDFIDRSDVLDQGYKLSLPTTPLSKNTRASMEVSGVTRSGAEIKEFFWLAEKSPERWAKILSELGVLRDVSEVAGLAGARLPAGHAQFRIRDASGLTLVRAISSVGDIFPDEQLHQFNSELDRLDYDSGLIVTLGQLGSVARTLATQLSSRKKFRYYERMDLLRMISESIPGPIDRKMAALELTSDVEANIVFTDEGISLLAREPAPRCGFLVIDSKGDVPPESSPIVRAIRSLTFANNESIYGIGGNAGDAQPTSEFDRQQYLRGAYELCNDVRYAPLAALGFRFKSASLSDMYVEPSAHVGGSSKRSLALANAVSEFVQSLDITQDQRDELEVQLRTKHGLSGSAEVGAARRLYQRYNNVVVLGDPGSGKTCFVKHEILSYCDASGPDSDWYSKHLPVFVSLAEASRLISDSFGLLDASVVLMARRGILLPRVEIDNALSSGTAAFFFDGLDEVADLETRIKLLNEIEQLMAQFAPRGCRFVLSSRPAAIQPVDLPKEFVRLQLSGLTDDEIRLLATNVMANRVGVKDDAPGVEGEIIDRLLADARARPGLSRLARNPLLLTLLVLIYANSGALSARRHIVYTQAIKTLTSIRARETRRHQISESDLRARLGAVALAILRGEIAEIPQRQEVVRVLANCPSHDGVSQTTAEADHYLQDVAESTGLIALHSGDDARSPEYVTFMHYSFLEYYAAAGLLNESYLDSVPRTLGSARWRDVSTLLTGLLSDQADVTPLLVRILSSGRPWDRITGEPLLLALDCLSECDVPPEAAQRAIATAVHEYLTVGPGLIVADLRAEIAERLGSLVEVCGRRLRDVIVNGLRSADSRVREAFVDLTGRLTTELGIGESIVTAFNDSLVESTSAVRVAAISAMSRKPELRTNVGLAALKLCLRGSVAEKRAALTALMLMPNFVPHVVDLLRDLTSDMNTAIARLAAQVLLPEILRKGYSSEERERNRASAIRALESGFVDESRDYIDTISIERSSVEAMLGRGSAADRLLAFRYMPGVRGNEQWAYQEMSAVFRGQEQDFVIAASLDALRLSTDALSLVTIADTSVICGLTKHVNRSVRVAALRLLGEMPDEQLVITTLRRRLASGAEGADFLEVVEAAKALAAHVRRNEKIGDFALAELLKLVREATASGFGNASAQQALEALLLVCESMGGAATESDASVLYALATSHRTPIGIRRRSIRVFGRVVLPSPKATDTIISLLTSGDTRLRTSTYVSAVSYVLHVKQRVAFVRETISGLPKLRDVLVSAWQREFAQSSDSAVSTHLTVLRDGIVEISELLASYGDFAGHERVS